MSDPTDSDTTDKACGFDENEAVNQTLKNQWAIECDDCGSLMPDTKAFVRGARWQRSQDQAEIENERSVKEDYVRRCDRLESELSKLREELEGFKTLLATERASCSNLVGELNESLRDARKTCNEYALCIDLEQKKSKELSESNRVLAEALSNSIQQCGADSCSFPKCACHVEAKQALESAGVGK